MPNPTPEALVAKWREAAPTREDQFNDRTNTATADTLHRCADELEAALAAEGVQAGEVSAYDLAVLDDAAETLDRIGEGSAGLREARARIASALSQQPEARELLDARVIDSLINANEEIHAAAAELASCLAEAIAAGAGGILLTHRACMALKRHESLTELAPKAEARGVGDGCLHEWLIWPETDGFEQRCSRCGSYRPTPKADRTAALTEARNDL